MEKIDRGLILWLASAAAFLLIARLGQITAGIIKPFDLLMIIIGAYFFPRRAVLLFLKERRKEWLPFVWCAGAISFFLIIGQATGFFGGAGIIEITKDIALNHVRALFNSAVFFLTAGLIAYYPDLLVMVSRAVFFSPVLIIPAFFGFGRALYFDGGRLSGLFNNANIFAGWLAVIFIIGLYFSLFSRIFWARAASTAWLAIIAACIIWSGSRASWVAGFIGEIG